jgi:hypothetical protein
MVNLHGIPYWFLFYHSQSPTTNKVMCVLTNPVYIQYRLYVNIFILSGFVKHDLKGVLKCIRVKICTPPPHRRNRHSTEARFVALLRLVTSNNIYIVFHILIPQGLR